ncbi:MAG: histidine phosphatase family protein [Rhodospirillales bacterium]|nr:histidine phosphatase family protein [Rhodospirillales bacterium]
MVLTPPTRLLLIRHAPSAAPGRLAGRLDVPCTLPGEPVLALARQRAAQLCPDARLISSPARRCLETARALHPGAEISENASLWEQDFGAWEGLETTALPDLGPMNREELAAHRPPGGESFLELAQRAQSALGSIQGRAIIVTHAGVIRAALGMALQDVSQGLAFEVAPFSATLLTVAGGEWSVGFVNLALAP